MWYGTWNPEIEDWHVKLFMYLVFGLAPTMTMLTGLVVGFLHGRVEQGGRWGLGMALLSSPFGLVTIMLASLVFDDDKTADLDSSTTWFLCAVPYVISGLVFSCFTATMIWKRAGGRE